MNPIMAGVLTIAGAAIGLATLSVFVSRNSAAPAVIQAASSGLANVIAAATSPGATAPNNGHLGLSSFTLPSFQLT